MTVDTNSLRYLDRARIAACTLRTATDRFKANYNIDALCNQMFIEMSNDIACVMLSTPGDKRRTQETPADKA